MKKGAKEEGFIKQPYFEGGPAALAKYINLHLQYPPEALEHKISGVVELMMEIDHEGKVTDAQILSSLGHGCDEEAKRMAKLLRFTVPKNPRKMKFIFQKRLRVQFKLPVVVKPSLPAPKIVSPPQYQGMQYNYTVTAPKPILKAKVDQKPQTFQYTIKIG